MKTVALVGLLLFISSCQKKPEATAAPSASVAATPPAASVAAEPVASASASAAPSAAVVASAAPAVTATATPEQEALARQAAAGGAKEIQTCCAALAAAAKKGGKTKNQYVTAGAVCAGLASSVKAGKANATAAKVTLRGQLAGAPVPSGC